MIKEAAEFASRAHEGCVRKGTDIPYITHPFETAVIVSELTDDEEVISAALLHDVIEDAGTKKEELEELFGPRVASLVVFASEDKSKPWYERKKSRIEGLKDASHEDRIICLADKLSNLRSTVADRMLKGEKVWEKFNVKDKRAQEWYYRTVFDHLGEFKDEPAYKEYERLLEELFG